MKILVPTLLAISACSSDTGSESSTGGTSATTGGAIDGFGGSQASGGATSTGGTGMGTGGSGTATGGAAMGGAIASGGALLGGASSTGGSQTGGATSAGGTVSAGGTSAVGGAEPTGGANPAGGAGGEGGVASGGMESVGGAPPAGGESAGGSDAPGGSNAGGSVSDAGSDAGGTAGAGTGGQVADPFADLAQSAAETGLLLANRFSRQNLSYSSVANLPGDGYKSACEWYGSLGVASLTDSQQLLSSLVSKFDPFKANFVADMTNGEAHVDRYIYGIVPLEIYLQTGDESYRGLGTQVADRQQVTNQTRNAIDDMFMMTSLQLQAYRATQDTKYLDFMASTMVDYLAAQQPNGLFFHNVTEARVHWGRGNGWFAAGMAEMMRDLPEDHAAYGTIVDGYMRMMEGLLQYQGSNGMWYQVIDMPNDPSNWPESSCTAMFTYAMIAGVKRGTLDAATYVPVVERAWEALQGRISSSGDVSDICTGTWYKSTPQEYMALTRLTGDGHGQAPVLWCAAELLR